MDDFTVAGFFAGIGGVELGFEEAGFNPVFANEWDKYAAKTYTSNFDHKHVLGDINSLDLDVIPETTVLTGGFPCQAFSIAGKRAGFQDERGRGNLFFRLAEIIEAKQPEVVLLENVKHLITHDKGDTFKVILKTLDDLGYHATWKVLNAKDYGNIPQGRERVYIIAFKDEEKLAAFKWPEPVKLTAKLSDFIDFDTKVDDKYYYTEEKFPYMFPTISDGVTRQDRVYQWRRVYVRENQSGVCPTLVSVMGTGGHNVPIVLAKHGIRKLTPRECFNLMGFPKDHILPEGMSNAQLYKQAGNAVVVAVARRLAESIKVTLEN